MTSMTPDRRPIPGRSLAISQRCTALFVRLGISANAISIAGLFFGVLVGVLLASTHPSLQFALSSRVLLLLAALCVFCRLLCNMFDGMVALASGKQSAVGAIYNELPDRISDAATLIGAGYAAAYGGSEPVLGFVAALLAVLTAYIRTLGKAEGAGNDFCGPMAKPHRMWTIIIACIAGAIAPGVWHVQSVSVLDGKWSVHISAMWVALVVIILGSAVTCIRRVRRIARTLTSTR
jgi:phosphatidylglycerophosphate synthase